MPADYVERLLKPRRRQKLYCISTMTGNFANDLPRREAVKELRETVKAEAARCRARYKRCSVIRTGGNPNSIDIRIGGRQGYHFWQRYSLSRCP